MKDLYDLFCVGGAPLTTEQLQALRAECQKFLSSAPTFEIMVGRASINQVNQDLITIEGYLKARGELERPQQVGSDCPLGPIVSAD